MSQRRRFSEVVQIRWDGEELAAIDQVAAALKMTRSDLIRDAVAAYVEVQWTKLQTGTWKWFDEVAEMIRKEREEKRRQEEQQT